jgi:hypothetical protein
MARRSIAGLPPQYSKNAGGASASGYWLKLYDVGTTTNKLMWTLDIGGSSLTKCKLNTRGEPISNSVDDDSVFVPYVDGGYKAALYATAADADADNTANALWACDNISNYEGEGYQSIVSAEFATVATMKSATPLNNIGPINWGDYLGRKISTVVSNTTSNAGGADYVITNVNPGNLSTLVGGIWVGANHDLGGGYYAELKYSDAVPFVCLGALLGGNDDRVSFEAARLFSNSIGLPLDFRRESITFSAGADVLLPAYGMRGFGVFSGATCKWFRLKNMYTHGHFEFNSGLAIDSVWESQIAGTMIVTGDLLLQSTDALWGTFWNDFIATWRVSGEIIIDVDGGQSVNQNKLGNTKCAGLRVRGVSGSGARECHANRFAMLDTTTANMTAADGSTGWHIINESVLNQSNTIEQWYSEGTGKRSIRGNWNVIGSNVDATSAFNAQTERNHYLFSNSNIQRNNGDFFAGNPANLAVGGEWDILAEAGDRPKSLNPLGTTASATALGAAGVPSNIYKEYCRSTSSSFSGFQINFNLPHQQAVVFSMWYKGDDFATAETDGGDFNTPSIYFTHSSGWKLLRMVFSNVTKWVKLYMNAAGATAKTTSINSFFASATKTTFLPQAKFESRIFGTDTNKSSGATVAIAIPVDDVAGNSNGAGVLTVRARGYSDGPTVGIAGIWKGLVTRNVYAGVPTTTVVTVLGSATQGINSAGVPTMVAVGTTTGVNFTTTLAGADNYDLRWVYEPLQFD